MYSEEDLLPISALQHSRPVRARGLKLFHSEEANDLRASRPVRARGLKHGVGRLAEVGERRAPCGRVD